MANNKNKKKSTQKQETAAAAPSQAASKATAKSTGKNAVKSAKPARGRAAKAKTKKNGKPGVFARIAAYFKAVKTEMHRVTWPSKKDLVNFSLVVIVSLIIVGVVIALLDTVVGEGLFLVSGLRG